MTGVDPGFRQRLDLLRRLSDAYLAIAAGATLEERLEEVCVQAQRFFGAEDARLAFGVDRVRDTDAEVSARDEITAVLSGSGGLLTLRARPGNTWGDDDCAALEQLALLISAPIDDARRLDFSERLERIGAFISGAADRVEVLDRLLLDPANGIGADDAGLWLNDGQPAGLVTTFDGPPPPRVALLAAVAESGESIFLANHEAIADRVGDSVERDLTRGAWAVVPVEASAGRLGAMGLWYDEHQPFDAVQRTFITQIAHRVALVLERGRQYEVERLARHEAEQASKQFRALQELATDLSRAVTRRRVAHVLLRRALRFADAMGGIVAVAEERGLEVLAQSGTLDPGPGGFVDTPDRLLADLLDEVRSVNFEVVEFSDELRRRLDDHGVLSLGVYPIVAGSRSVGVMILGWRAPFAADVIDDLLRAQVAVAGPALARAERYDIEHEIAETLQRSILTLPDVDLPGVRWATHYRTGSAGLAGGDWYDIYSLDEHRVAISVGDIVGKGVEAAASMGQLRSATRALSQHVEGPAALLTAVDRFTTATGQGRYSSMIHLVLDTRSCEFEYSVAGHPPPVLRRPDGTTALLEDGRGPLLGVECERRAGHCAVPSGTLLLLYTDGLIERRSEPIDAGIRRLSRAVDEIETYDDPDDFCTKLASRLLTARDVTDDVAIVAVDLVGKDGCSAPRAL